MQQLTWKTSPFGEAYIAEIGTGIFDQHPAKDVFNRYLNKDFREPHHLIVVVGSDSGLLLPYLVELAKETKSYYICYEEDAVISPLLENGWQDTEQVRLVPPSFDISSLFVDQDFTEFFLRLAVKIVPSLAVATKKLNYIDLWNNVRNEVKVKLIPFANSGGFINRHLDNMTELVFPIRLLRNQLNGKTAVLLGGGPSVEQVFDWVRTNRENLVLFAANRISSRLKVEKITPDFFVAVDPQPELLDYCKDMFDFAGQSILLTTASVASNVLHQWPGKMAYAETVTPFYPLNESECQLVNFKGTGPTVMNTAFQAACYMGASNIILAGMDLCHTLTGQSHESSSKEASVGRFIQATENKVLTYSGLYAPTTPQMELARNILQEQVNVWKVKTRFWQINPNAAKVNDIELIDLNKLPFVISPVTTEINQVHALLNWTPQAALAHLDYLQRIVDYRLTLYRKLIKRIIPVLRDVKRLTRLSPPALSRATKQLVRAKNSFENSLGPERFLLFEHAYLDYVKVAEPLEGSENGQQSLSDIQALLTNFFTAAYRSLDSFAKHLDEITLLIELRKQEAHGLLSEQMLAQWQARHEPGRGAVWLAHHDQRNLTEEEQAILYKAQNEFKYLLEHSAPSFVVQFEDIERQVDSLIEQIKIAYHQSDTARLAGLIDYLTAKGSGNFLQLASFAQMAEAMLRKDWLSVIAFSEQINLPILHIAKYKWLVKVYFETDDPLSVLTSLEVLCREDAKYFSIYADVASKLGFLELAEFAYQMAVQNNPSDALTFNEVYQWAQQHQRTALLAWLADWAIVQENKSN